MKTIKEIQALIDSHPNLEAFSLQGYKQALKDVMKLIDELSNELDILYFKAGNSKGREAINTKK